MTKEIVMFEKKEAFELLVGDIILVDNIERVVTNVFRGRQFNNLTIMWKDGSMEVHKNTQVIVL
jgi:hypothetical protein